MNPEETLLFEIFGAFNQALHIAVGPSVAEIVDALLAGNPTDEQLSLFTDAVHREFDGHDGCMISTLKEMEEVGYPHYALMHVIRTYVRLVDKREMEGQKLRDESHNARYGKEAQGAL